MVFTIFQVLNNCYSKQVYLNNAIGIRNLTIVKANNLKR